MRAQHLSLAVLAAGALAVAGCGGDDNKSSDSGGGGSSSAKQNAPASGGASAVNLAASEFKFDPSDPSVKKTGVVTFRVKNGGQVTHALEVEGPGEEKKTGNIAPGQSAALKVDISKPGSYEFYCPVDGHKQQGMKGEVKVGGGGGSSSSSGSKSGGGSSGY
jgi:uncharacterized cupredoxin-like copper-binding protein